MFGLKIFHPSMVNNEYFKQSEMRKKAKLKSKVIVWTKLVNCLIMKIVWCSGRVEYWTWCFVDVIWYNKHRVLAKQCGTTVDNWKPHKLHQTIYKLNKICLREYCNVNCRKAKMKNKKRFSWYILLSGSRSERRTR